MPGKSSRGNMKLSSNNKPLSSQPFYEAHTGNISATYTTKKNCYYNPSETRCRCNGFITWFVSFPETIGT